jgi:lipid II:glycine glycyltransferase (peptidoglycan interpeptide bridge formation enzyme)
VYSGEQIQFRNTILIDLNPTEDEILTAMKQKTRYNVRLAARKGVKVRTGTESDFGLLYQMYAETSLRDGFAIREAKYYHRLWKTFFRTGVDSDTKTEPVCEPLIAEIDGEAAAAVVIFRFAGKGYYMHGMSVPNHRNAMPNHLLQWEAMKRAKAAGCEVYDLWGAPETFNEGDVMWGVYRFKEGFGGTVQRTIGAYDHPIKPLVYKVYTELLPKALDFLRQRGRSRIARNLTENKNVE